MNLRILVVLASCIISCKADKPTVLSDTDQDKNIAAISLFGIDLEAPAPSQKLIDQYELHRSNYLKDTTNIDNLIWFARFEAYKANYNEAIEILSQGIKNFPADARLYRHRGHRQISIRNFDAAIDDLEKAAQLIEGKENEIEPDGMPNKQNIPVSTLHGNIWYHLGLAYYLKDDMNNAFRGFKKCLDAGNNDDNIVSSTHWLYMILRRLNKEKEANSYLEAIKKDMKIIENFAYHDICLFYKGDKTLAELQGDTAEGSSNDAIAYAIANWHLYNGDLLYAKPLYDKLLARDSWNSFGYIAAEADHVREF